MEAKAIGTHFYLNRQQMDMRDPLEKAVDKAAVARRVRNAETTILEQHYEIARLTRELEVQRNSQISAVNGMLKAEQDCDRLTRERDAARAALTEVGNATAVPLPDPNAHSWRAFYDAACTRLTRCADAARRGLRNVEQTTPADYFENYQKAAGSRWCIHSNLSLCKFPDCECEQKAPTLDDLVSKITPENRHDEQPAPPGTIIAPSATPPCHPNSWWVCTNESGAAPNSFKPACSVCGKVY